MRQRGPTFLQCMRRNLKDWILLLILIVILPFTEEVQPRRMYITDSVLKAIKFPFQPSTVPSWSVPLYSTFVPSAVIGAHGLWMQAPTATTHAAVLGALTSVALTADITNFFKLQVQRCSSFH